MREGKDQRVSIHEENFSAQQQQQEWGIQHQIRRDMRGCRRRNRQQENDRTDHQIPASTDSTTKTTDDGGRGTEADLPQTGGKSIERQIRAVVCECVDGERRETSRRDQRERERGKRDMSERTRTKGQAEGKQGNF